MRHMLTYFIVFVLLTVINCGRQFRCDYKYYNEAHGWLKLHKIPANWREARLRCHLEGSKLASPLNADLASVMLSILEQAGTKCGAYTGIHAYFSRGDFHSIEGIPLSKIPHTWAEGEPDNYNDQESCIVMEENGKLADANCSEPLPYLCYRKSNYRAIVNSCGTVDNEYKLDPHTGSCYKFHTTARTWSRAYMACTAEGGYLAIINSDTEAQVIQKLFAKHSPGSMRGTFFKESAFIGFHDWGEHGEFLTIEGQSLEEAGYAKFKSGQPNNITRGQFCGAVYRDALLNDMHCEHVYAFFCEKSPDSLLCEDDDQEDQ